MRKSKKETCQRRTVSSRTATKRPWRQQCQQCGPAGRPSQPARDRMPKAVSEPMGRPAPQAAAQVRERHLRALYINIPIEPAAMQALLLPPAAPHVHAAKAWLSIVLDDLFKLESPLGPCCFMPVPGMNGWMMKVNALVECPPSTGAEALRGYQILTLDFEQTRGPTSWVKVKGAQATQMVPTQRARFSTSAGLTGCTESSPMTAGTACSAEVASAEGEALVKLSGRLAPLDDESRALCEFVVGHPHKFLAQQGSPRCCCCPPRPATAVLSGSGDSDIQQQLAFASWREGFNCSAEGCMVRTHACHFSN